MKSVWTWVAAVATALVVSACGGGGGGSAPAVVAAGDATVSFGPSNGAVMSAFSGKTFSFAALPSSFGVSGTSTMTLTSNGTTASYALQNVAGSSTGPLTFGSCIFTPAAGSTFSPPHPLAPGATAITINPCAIKLASNGVPTGEPVDVDVTLTFGTGAGAFASSPIRITILISATGAVTVNGVPAGTVPVSSLTGVN
jgi:hypothetical protein